MMRFAIAIALLTLVNTLSAADKPAVARAVAIANDALTAGMPRLAADALEKILPEIDGDPAILGLLHQAYTDELKQQAVARTPDAARMQAIRDKLAVLNRPVAKEPTADLVAQAADLFKQARTQPAKFAAAAALYAKAATTKVELSPDQQAAWAYCRVRLAAEQWNAGRGDPIIAKEVIAEVNDAMTLAPGYPELQKFGATILTAAGGKAPEIPAIRPATAVSTEASGWFALEGASVIVRFPASARDQAEAVLKKAEECRTAIFSRWSGPPSAAWTARCEIVLHAGAADFAAATRQPAAATGHALVQFEAGQPKLRRIDLRMDDDMMLEDALPREMTHIVLADLFPTSAPPRWAAEGMALLAMSPTTIEKYVRNAPAVARRGQLPGAGDLIESTAPPTAEKVTGFVVGSVSLVDFLARQKGDKTFTTFLRDAKRYGAEKAVERQYGYATFGKLDAAMKAEKQN